MDGGPETQHGSSVLHRDRRGPRIERHWDRSWRPVRIADHQLRTRRSAYPRRTAQLQVSRPDHQPGRGQGGARRLRALDHLELSHRCGERRPPAGRRHRLPGARFLRDGRTAAAGRISVRTESQLDLYADDPELPQEHRDGSRAHVRPPARSGRGRSWRRRTRRRRLRRGRGCRGHAGSSQHPHASLDRRATGRELQAARLRSPFRLQPHVVRELLRAIRHADDGALHPPASAREEGPLRGDQ